MDVSLSRPKLFKELQYINSVVERKTTVPILANVLLETVGNTLRVTVTDLDVTLRCNCEASVKVSGTLTVSARKFFDIVRFAPEDAEIHLKTNADDWLEISYERSRFKLATLAKSNFPDIGEVSGKTVMLEPAVVRGMISRCVFAITQEESRYTLNGALAVMNRGGITLVATDGHRLVLVRREFDLSSLVDEVRVLIPKKALVEVLKLADEPVASLEFGIGEKQLFFKIGERLLISRILSGEFPNYEMVIPKENNRRIVVRTADFVDSLRRVSVLADELTHAVKLSVSEGQVELSSTNSEVGQAKETIAVEYEGESVDMGFNAHYLLDFLLVLESEQVVLDLRDSETQGLLHPHEDGEYLHQYVIMPMSI